MRDTIKWILTGFRLLSLWTKAVGLGGALRGCLWVLVRKALPRQTGLANALMPRSRILELNIPGYKYPFFARWPASDLHILYTIAQCREYSPIAELVQESANITFLDLGANIGAASRYFLETFPSSRVIAVEPNAGNVKIWRMNLAPYSTRAQIVEGAIWNKNASLTFETGTAQVGTEAGVQVRELGAGENPAHSVRAVDIPTLLLETGVPKGSRIVLKMDVEGSEQEVFGSPNLDWLSGICCIAIELHDRFRTNSSKNFFSAVENRLVKQPQTINDTVFVLLK